jgi:chlorite dismutase
MSRLVAVLCGVLLLAGCGGRTTPPTPSPTTSTPPQPQSPTTPAQPSSPKALPITKAEAEPAVQRILNEWVHPTEKSKIVYLSEPMESDADTAQLYSKYGVHAFYVTRSDYLLGAKEPTYYQYVIWVGHKDRKPYAAGWTELKSVLEDPKQKDWLAKYPPPKPPTNDKK